MSRIRRRVRGRTKDVVVSNIQSNQENMAQENDAPDEDIIQARSTIERLARKYLDQSPSSSLDIVKTNSYLQEENTSRLHFTEPTTDMERKKELVLQLSPVKVSPRKPGLVGKRHKTLQRRKSPSIRHAITSPVFKLPKPTLGHSTPGDLPAPRRDSLFGFDVLESPLTLSPVQATSYVETPTKTSPQKPNVSHSSFSSKLQGTYDLAVRSKPTPNKKQGRKKSKQCSTEVQKWIKELNSEFAEVDDFELAVE